MDLTETALRAWVKRADIDAGKGPPEALTTEARGELQELRKRVKRLEMEREILKNHRGRRPTLLGEKLVASYDPLGSEERPAAFWRPVPVKKHGPGSAAVLGMVSSDDPV